ncbi:MAG: sigma-70 family RNA polymerase sigma factor [Clostridia bacterium]|jgi:RNA polymerase sigma-70 factor (ECF subfamily)|nr:sigma-70 family RNA polymerase sigma factor [Clostridia bacterium]MCI1999243.1 sigma-70 family RNA polymerase sigma factor [Clostridia bacterium]MCI2014804.1 sigma-70 family RNA polymerase sigma factor [Clostridia bacterium]
MDSIDEIYAKHSKMIYYFLLSKTSDRDTAEELTQETFYQAIKCIKSFKGKSSVSTWLCGIAENVWHSWLRKQKNTINTLDEEASADSVEDKLIIKWDAKEILKYLHSLNEPIREVIYLRLIGNLSFKDIGDIMEKSENWARVNFYRGKEKIIKEVKKDERKDTL